MIDYENLAESNKPFLNELLESFESTLRRGWFILGKDVESFERAFADYLGCRHCVGVGSGLDALILSLDALNLERGGEVLVPSNTYIATIMAILRSGLKPVLVEPDIRTYNIDPARIEEKITSNSVAILVVHLYGKPCEMDPILKIAEKHHLRIVEDCAQAHGARYKGRAVGTFGDFGAFSFYPTKNLGALGDGGAATTDNEGLAVVVRKLRNYGSSVRYQNDLLGFNSRLDEVQAGFLLVKLKKLDEINQHKRNLASLYLKYLKEDFIRPVVSEDCYDVYHIFNVRHPMRDKLKTYLLEKGIKTDIHYMIPPHKQKALQGVLDGEEYPIAQKIHDTTLSLPISYFHTEKDILAVIEAMNLF
jgi:dTDP-4-amino-4,6-dideoxygalactose transaminase